MINIYGTLGPACADRAVLEEMFRAGMSGVRLNLSHVSLRQARAQVDSLRLAAASCGTEPKLLIDMQGPELRLGALEEPLPLREGECIELGGGGLPMPGVVLSALKPGQELLLDDGKLLLTVSDVHPGGARAKILRGGLLRGRKSIALPGADIHPPTMTESDLENLACAAEFGVSAVMQPFVRGREDLSALRAAMDSAGGSHIRLLAKIENMQGLEKLPELIDHCDEIVIARGDLGNAMPLWQLPSAQKRISALCREKGRDFMVVTQMLASMEQNPVPTRAEVSDIFNAVLDGASSLMVTGETAVGKHPADVIRYLKNTADSALEFLSQLS